MGEKYSREQFAAQLGANGDPKLNAAADFAARLLNGPIGDKVARIVLFGSVARGEARPESDVDVMVFANAARKVIAVPAGEASWEATVEWGESVEHLIYTLADLVQPRAYVVYNALKRGREIYTMNENDFRRQEARNLYDKASQILDESEVSLKVGAAELSVVGAYTASELAAKALLLLKPDIELPSTHGGLIQIFGREYIKTNEAPAIWGGLLREKLEVRRRALYDTTIIEMTEDDAQPVIDLAHEMLNFLKRKLDEDRGFTR
jgi:uncharacterized protein (UPF0332 family)/predicted nucleotidyltransferase